MIRKSIIVLLTFAAAGTGFVDYLSRSSPLMYYKKTVAPTWCTLSVAQAERGKLRIVFASLGHWVFMSEKEHDAVYSGFVGSVVFTGVDGPLTLRQRLRNLGFHVGFLGGWTYAWGTDDSGRTGHWKAMERSFRIYVPAWFLILVFLGYPAIALVRSPARRRRRRRKIGLCVGCAYDLTGNESGTCPECGEAR